MRKVALLLVFVAMAASLAACSSRRGEGCCSPYRTYGNVAPPKCALDAMTWPNEILVCAHPTASCADWPESVDRFGRSGSYYLEQVFACACTHAKCNMLSPWLDVAEAANDCRRHKAPYHAHFGPQWSCQELLRRARYAYLNACGSCPSVKYCLDQLNHGDGRRYAR